MNVDDQLNEQDQRLLEKVEMILSNETVSQLEEDSMYGMCAHLASTVPLVSPGFEERLWEKIAAIPVGMRQSDQAGHFAAWSRRAPSSRNTQPARGRLLKLHTAWAVAIILLVVVISLAFVPPVKAFVGEFIQRVILGEYSSVERGETPMPQPTPTFSAYRWKIETDLGGDTGEIPPGGDAAIRSAQTIDEAQKMAGFPLWVPGYLPDGYAFRQALLPPEHTIERVYLFFSGPGKDITIILTPVGEKTEQGGSEIFITMETTVTLSVIYTNGSLEETTVHDHPAAWVDGKMLVWEENGVNYVVGGLDLSLEEATSIAESMKPFTSGQP